MTDPFDPQDQPQHPRPEEFSFDLDRVLSSVVGLRSEIPKDAFTAQTLGTERGGNGVLIDDGGLVLTIGYLITEAESVWLVDFNGKATAGHPVAADSESGFGLVQALGRLDVPAIEIGSSRMLQEGDSVIVAGHGGRRHAGKARVISKREFAGYWEYVLDEGIFTAPAHPNWGGAALIAGDGTLRGIGSLFVQHLLAGETLLAGNMIVPIDLLPPIIDELLTLGRTRNPPRPWLGMFTSESEEKLVVAGLANDGPAYRADVRVGDLVVAVGDAPVKDLANMYRSIWALGGAGVEVPLTLEREGDTVEVRVASADRSDFLKAPRLH